MATNSTAHPNKKIYICKEYYVNMALMTQLRVSDDLCIFMYCHNGLNAHYNGALSRKFPMTAMQLVVQDKD